MSAVLQEIDAPEEFFAPTSATALDHLLGQHARARRNIEAVREFMSSEEMRSAAGYYLAANKNTHARYAPEPAELFKMAPALKALDAHYWDQALRLTDVLDYMPAARREEWFKHIRDMDCPDFEEASVRATLQSLMAQRMDFLSEMVDGIFRGLSGEHVTNRPEGFSKRMIIQGVVSMFGAGRKEGLIHDMRAVVAKFMGRDQPHYGSTHRMLAKVQQRRGEWHSVDGGAFRIRVYQNSNAHLEVHPDIAWRLNQVLAHLYPAAIPSRLRRPPAKKKLRDFTLMQRPLPFAVIALLESADYKAAERVLHTGYRWMDADKHLKAEAVRVIEAIGGADAGKGVFAFDYDAGEVLTEVIISGVIPDHKSHQYYPTPRRLAAEAVRLADVPDVGWCLEPSAGQGAIAELLPKERTVCVEVSPLHCRVLEAKGFPHVVEGDFLTHNKRGWDRIVMNPPFSQGRAAAHVQHAADLLAPEGRLVAILPASHADKDILPGFRVTWSPVYPNEFAGASVDVVIMTAEAA